MKSGKKSLEKIVLNEFPDSKVVVITDAIGNAVGRSKAGIQKAPSLARLKARVGRAEVVSAASDAVAAAGKVRARARATSAKAGPSGIVTITPKTADGAFRRAAKAVVVSRGKVIALQG